MIASLLGTAASAQLGTPRLGLPRLPVDVSRLPLVTAPETGSRLPDLQSLRRSLTRALLREHADLVEADPTGEPVRRQELLLVSPSEASLQAALGAGYTLLRDQALDALEMRQVVLRPPAGLSTAQALRRLRALDPGLDADYNHLYTPSGEASPDGQVGVGATASPPDATPTPAPVPARPIQSPAEPDRVGLVDGGIDRRHPALRAAPLQSWGCADVAVPSAHGTAVASLLVGRDGAFTGAAPGAALYAADIYCGRPAGGAAEDIAGALAWLAQAQVGVVNISLVGPPNRLLERAVQALVRRGHLLVAAVGNDGPAAPPLYPAAYPGVIGVTGVSPRRRVLPEAAQGPQVMYAAPGDELAAARPGGGYADVRGTSYAAPIVAGLLAPALPAPDLAGAAAAVAALSRSALDLGATGRDTVYGLGLVGEGARIAPQRVQAMSR